jgi:hypothetical protein
MKFRENKGTWLMMFLMSAILLGFISILFGQRQINKNNNPQRDGLLSGQILDGKSFVQLGDAAVITLTLANNEDSDINVAKSCPTLDYQLTLKNELGQPVNLTKEGLRLTSRTEMVCQLKRVKLTPGQSLQTNINLSELFEMFGTGKYFLTATRGVSKNDQKGNLIWRDNEIVTVEINIKE